MSALALGRSQRLGWLRWPALPAEFPGLFVALSGAALSLRPAVDSDLGWHLRTGQLILASGQVPRADPFSHTMAGHPWVDNEWLWEASVAALHAGGGALALLAANALLVTATVGLIYATLRLRRLPPLVAALGASLGLIGVVIYADVRPGMMGILFSAAFLYLLERQRQGGGWRWLLGLLPCELLWANTHGSYVLGPLLVAIYAVAALREAQAWRSGHWRLALPWLGLGAALLIVSAANPRGIGLLQFTLGASRLSFNRHFVQAWMAPNFDSVAFLPLLLMIAGSLALALLAPAARLPKTEALLLLACTLAVLKSNEFEPLYAVAAAPLLAQMSQGVLRRPLSWSPSRLALALFALASAGLLGMAIPRLTPAASARAVRQRYPVAAVSYIQRHQLAGPLWNDFDWGGYLIGAIPRLPVLVDSRTEMYGQAFLSEYLKVARGLEPPTAMFSRYGIHLALIRPSSALATELRANTHWREAYHNSLAAVFVRQA